MHSPRLPFGIPSIYGCARIDGLLILEAAQVCLEYKMKDKWLGALSSGIIKRAIAYERLEKAESFSGFFSPSLVLTARNLDAFHDLPHQEPNVLRLCVAWKHRKNLRAIVAEINFRTMITEAERYQRELRPVQT